MTPNPGSRPNSFKNINFFPLLPILEPFLGPSVSSKISFLEKNVPEEPHLAAGSGSSAAMLPASAVPAGCPNTGHMLSQYRAQVVPIQGTTHKLTH